jgi:pimeloyl-ACP methyl ester carboxylesterase
MEPALNYARTSDGVTIAYTAAGSGPGLVWLPSLSHVEAQWQVPVLRDTYQRLAASLRLVLFDGRGTGRSQRDVDPADLGLDGQLRDLEAVIGHLGLERVAIIGLYHAVAPAIAYAARHPGRVSHLVLFGGSARTQDTMSAPQTQALLSLMERDWDLFAETAAHAWTGWDAGESARRLADVFRTASTPAVARATFEAAASIDVTDELPKVRAPALVLHRPSDRQSSEGARHLAEALPAGQLVTIPGTTPALFLEDTAGDVDVIVRFLTDAPPALSREPAPARADGLTGRETEVLRLLAGGDSNAEIAAALGVSVHTVERHAANLYRKIGARGRADAIAWAFRRGIT